MEQIVHFYIKNLSDQSIWAVHDIDDNTDNRLGWLKTKCIDVGNDSKTYIGADMGIDAAHVFLSENFDFSKTLQGLGTIHPQNKAK